jgi:hypothetical protein
MTLGDVRIDYRNAIYVRPDHSYFVLWLFRETKDCVADWIFAQYRYAIVAFLTPEDTVIVYVVKGAGRKVCIPDLGFLKAKDIHLIVD